MGSGPPDRCDAVTLLVRPPPSGGGHRRDAIGVNQPPSPDDLAIEHGAELVAQYAPWVLLAVLVTTLTLTWAGWRLFEWAWRTLRARFPDRGPGGSASPLPYLALHLGVGLGLAWAAMHTFAELSETLGQTDRLGVFDTALARQLHVHASVVGLWAFRAVAWLGGLPVMLSLLVGVAVWLGHRREWVRAAGWTAALVGDAVLNTALKASYQRIRPSAGWTNPFVTEPGWSFPSGHAMGSIVAYGMLAYLLVTHERTGAPGRRLGIVAAALATVLLVGFSRIYLTVHYFSDVAGGYAAGGAWLAVCVTGTEIARRQRARRAAVAADGQARTGDGDRRVAPRPV